MSRKPVCRFNDLKPVGRRTEISPFIVSGKMVFSEDLILVINSYLNNEYKREDGEVIIYRKHCINPVREGDWADVRKVFLYHEFIYCVSAPQAVALAWYKDEDTFKYFVIPEGESHEIDWGMEIDPMEFARNWFLQLHADTHAEYLKKLLEREFLRNPMFFL